MASRVCFNRHQKNQTASDYMRRKKALTLYSNTSDLEENIIKDASGCLIQAKNYDTLLDITKGSTIFNNKYLNNTSKVLYSGESYQMFYTQKDLSGENLIISNYGGDINTLDASNLSTVVIDISNTVFNQSCGTEKEKTVPEDMIQGDLLDGFAYPYKIHMPT